MSDDKGASAPTDEQTGAHEPEKHGIRETAAETVAKAVGITVEVGSMLSGQAGDIVSAERAVAEAETEDLLERAGEDEG